jgi:hypothetical protein
MLKLVAKIDLFHSIPDKSQNKGQKKVPPEIQGGLYTLKDELCFDFFFLFRS